MLGSVRGGRGSGWVWVRVDVNEELEFLVKIHKTNSGCRGVRVGGVRVGGSVWM